MQTANPAHGSPVRAACNRTISSIRHSFRFFSKGHPKIERPIALSALSTRKPSSSDTPLPEQKQLEPAYLEANGAGTATCHRDGKRAKNKKKAYRWLTCKPCFFWSGERIRNLRSSAPKPKGFIPFSLESNDHRWINPHDSYQLTLN